MYRPIKDWVVTKVVEQKETVSESGLILLDMYKAEKTKMVEILAMGPDANPGGLLKVGDVVLVEKHTGLKVDGEEPVEFAKAHNFLGVVE